MKDSIGFTSARGYLLLIRKECYSFIASSNNVTNVGLAFTRGSSLKNSEDSFYLFLIYFSYVHGFTQFCTLFLLFTVDIHSLLCTVFYSGSSNIRKVLSVISLAQAFVFENCNVYHEDWIAYSNEIDRPGDLCYIFSSSNDFN